MKTSSILPLFLCLWLGLSGVGITSAQTRTLSPELARKVVQGLAGIMVDHRGSWSGTLVLLAAPAEEPGRGAATMVGKGRFITTPLHRFRGRP